MAVFLLHFAFAFFKPKSYYSMHYISKTIMHWHFIFLIINVGMCKLSYLLAQCMPWLSYTHNMKEDQPNTGMLV
jgi:hypothetical protein